MAGDETLETFNELMTMKGIRTLETYLRRSRIYNALHAIRCNYVGRAVQQWLVVLCVIDRYIDRAELCWLC